MGYLVATNDFLEGVTPSFSDTPHENQQFWIQERLSRYINYILHRTHRRCLWKTFISISLLIIQKFWSNNIFTYSLKKKVLCFQNRVLKKSLLFMTPPPNHKSRKRNVNCIPNLTLWRPWNLTIVFHFFPEMTSTAIKGINIYQYTWNLRIMFVLILLFSLHSKCLWFLFNTDRFWMELKMNFYNG